MPRTRDAGPTLPQGKFQTPLDTFHATEDQGTIGILFKRLLQLSLDNSPDIRIARDFYRQKIAQRHMAGARRWAPRIDLQLSQEEIHNFSPHTDTTSVLGPGGNPTGTSSHDRSLSNWEFFLNMPLYSRSLAVGLESANLEYLLAKAVLDLKTDELSVNLRQLLGDYLLKSYRLLNLDNSIRLSKEHLANIEKAYRLREQTKLQLLRAQANLKILEGRKDLDEQRQKASFRELVRLAGLPVGQSVFTEINRLVVSEAAASRSILGLSSLDRTLAELKPWIQVQGEAAIRRYFVSHSLIYRKLNLEEQLAHAEAWRLMQNEWPDLSIRGLYQKEDSSRFLDTEGGSSIALVLNIPLFSGGTLVSSYHAQSKAQHLALVKVRDNVRKTVFALQNDRKLIVNLTRLLAKQKIHLAQQTEIVRLSLKSYTLKKTSMQDLLTSWNTLIDVKNELMQTTTELGTLLRKYAFELGLSPEHPMEGKHPDQS